MESRKESCLPKITAALCLEVKTLRSVEVTCCLFTSNFKFTAGLQITRELRMKLLIYEILGLEFQMLN